ncbi:hypothetical protein RvY_15741 [Ramazzottius varieornatus]|uniref:Sushi, von Willebrand factor type A, EGF and pentraxin domain-containing protein 1 n=1 Tax=Ramazzottius varieornatus TaxID=947166 RepID=A0A1D1VX49_RAMVA|nr:hypothetical protein RvY_15741 [Ramazzottius varieornatus]
MRKSSYICALFSFLLLTSVAGGRSNRVKGTSAYELAAAHETIRLCPRNLDNVDTGYRKCLRPCVTDNDCKGRRKKCLCDGDCGMSCVKPNTKCAPLTDPLNGKVHTTGIEAFGARVFYTCQPEFKLKGLRARSCQGDGTWSHEAPVCQPDVKCGNPPEIPHAQHNADWRHHQYELDTMIQYTCESGYAIEGFARAKCIYFNGTAKWFGPDLRCLPRNCGDPGGITNGYVEGSVFHYPHHVKFHCYPGYNLIGKSVRYCQRNGKWDGDGNPLCKAVECPRPADPYNGFAVVTSLKYESPVTYTCKPGYQVVNQEERRCQANQTWSGPEPKCEVVNCGPPPPIPNGGYNGTTTSFNSVVMFYCNHGFKFVGMTTTAKCKADGNWSHEAPKCFAPCTIPYIEFGTVNGSPGDRLSHGDLLNVSCVPKYELAYSASPSMCYNGTFTQIPTCQAASCKHAPPHPKRGLVIAPKTDHGMKARFICNKGFRIIGEDTATCEYGNWTVQTPPICQEMYCPWPGKLPNGTIYLVGAMGSYEYYDYIKTVVQDRQIRYECSKGYFLQGGPAGATCVDGNWSPIEKPKCHPGLHSPKSVFGRRMKRETLEAPCSDGLKSDRFEQSNLLKDPEDASHFIATIKCRPGFTVNVPDGSATCKNGMWKPRKPECVPLTCRVPETMNGYFKDFNQTVAAWSELQDQKVLAFACFVGFQISGPETILCSTGQWIPPVMPECIPASCHLPELHNGGYDGGYRSGFVVGHNSIIGFHCLDYFWRSPSESVVRCNLGILAPKSPECLSTSSTQAPARVNDLRREVGKKTESRNTTVVISEKSLLPPEVIPTTKNCSLGNLDHIVVYQANTKLNVSSSNIFPDNTELLFHCEHLGLYQLIGSPRLICTNNRWDGMVPRCESLTGSAEPASLPPAVHYRITSGIIGFSSHGELLVYPSTNLLLDCEWPRQKDTPSWTVSHSFRRYSKAWVDLDKRSVYRLSILHAVEEDSGVFTCLTPRGKAHSIIIKVRSVECPVIVPSIAGLSTNTSSTRMGTSVAFSCMKGTTLHGPKTILCLPTGSWSDVPPTCTSALCPVINPTSKHLKVYAISREPGSTVEFSCMSGTRLLGRSSAKCLTDASWSADVPQCEELYCSAPEPPQNGWLSKRSSSFKVGEKLEVLCKAGYAVVGGDSQLQCDESGNWSSETPVCSPSCNYPGHPENGRIILPSFLKFYYATNESITFACEDSFTLRGSNIIFCTENGRWSSRLPTCTIS